MGIRKRAGGALFVAAAAAASIGLTAATALAATTLTVKVTNGGTYKATTNKTVLTDRGNSATCTSTTTTKASTATGSIPSGTHTGTSPVKVGTVGTLNFKHCTSAFGGVTVKVNKLPYSVKVDSKTNSTGQTDGMITGINNSISIAGGLCTFTVTGSAPGFFSNSKHTLTLEPSSKLPIKPLNTARLTVSNVSGGCAGLVVNGDHPTFTATYTVSRAIVIKAS